MQEVLRQEVQRQEVRRQEVLSADLPIDPVSVLLECHPYAYTPKLKFVRNVSASSNAYIEAVEATHRGVLTYRDDPDHSVELLVFGPLIDHYRDTRIEKDHLAQEYTTVIQAMGKRLVLDDVRIAFFDLLANESIRHIFTTIVIKPRMIEPFLFSEIVKRYQNEFKIFISRRYNLGLSKSYFHEFTDGLEKAQRNIDICINILKKYKLDSNIYFTPRYNRRQINQDEFIRMLAEKIQNFEQGAISEIEFAMGIVNMISNELKILDNVRMSLLSQTNHRMNEIDKIMNFYGMVDVLYLAVIRADLIQMRLILTSFSLKDVYVYHDNNNTCYFNVEYAMSLFRMVLKSIENEVERSLILLSQQKNTMKDIIRRCRVWDIIDILTFHSFGVRCANARILIMRGMNCDPVLYGFMRIDRHAHKQGMNLHY